VWLAGAWWQCCGGSISTMGIILSSDHRDCSERYAEMTKQEFEHRFEHAKFSLNNVQNNIRFIDRKVAGGMGLIAIALGFFISRSLVAKQLVLLHEENFKFLIW
jgi:hypothetical protein